jgi:hypothetical protein
MRIRRFVIILVIVLVSAASFTIADQHPAKAYTPVPNGCGPENGPSVPNYFYFLNIWPPHLDVFPFVNACNNHDICYGTLGSNKATCDSHFLSDMQRICADNASSSASYYYCDGLAYTYYEAVHLFGQSAFDNAQAEARAGQ